MNMHTLSSIAVAAACVAPFCAAAADIFFAGDSTLAPRKGIKADAPETERCLGSWCEALAPYLKQGVNMHNLAVSGRSTKSFIDEGRWGKLIAQVKPGDYVYIQFGHNDQKQKDPKRYVSAEGGFSDNLARFAAEVRAKGGRPVFGTPMVRRFYSKDGRIADGLGKYPDAVRNMGRKLDVPVVDMNAFTRRIIEGTPKETSLTWFRAVVDGKDMTHPTKLGAKVFAKAFVEEVRINGLEMATLFRDPATVKVADTDR